MVVRVRFPWKPSAGCSPSIARGTGHVADRWREPGRHQSGTAHAPRRSPHAHITPTTQTASPALSGLPTYPLRIQGIVATPWRVCVTVPTIQGSAGGGSRRETGSLLVAVMLCWLLRLVSGVGRWSLHVLPLTTAPRIGCRHNESLQYFGKFL